MSSTIQGDGPAFESLQVPGPGSSAITGLTPGGPTFSGTTAPAIPAQDGTFVRTFDRTDRVVLGILTAGWIVAFVAFWAWWLQPDHRLGWAGLIINSVLLFYLSYLPSYFLVLVNRSRSINPNLAVAELRTAFIVTKAPSEPWPVARRTLAAMLAQSFPHAYDVWLADEDPTEEVLEWCRTNGVNVSTRRGVEAYHRTEWPRRTKCKEGNLAYFYDHWGYELYDVVAQLDCDHVPASTYLTEIVRPFSDPSIGYVAAPSVNDSNASESWSARGRLHREATFHGPFQLGHSDGLAPVCIGSHYAVRTKALASAGGLGPELAEDFSTSFLLTSAGWRSAFAHTAEAHGDGPRNFAAMVTQEFQWSRSLFMLFFNMLPRHIARFSWPLRIRFLFTLSYYPLLALTTAAGLALPVVAAVSGANWVNVNYFEFLARWMILSVFMIGATVYVRRKRLLRPVDAPIISWENWVYALARWPYVAWGVIAAVIQQFNPKPLSFHVTPKAQTGIEPLRTRLVLPYIVITGVMGVGALIGEGTTQAFGYVFLCLLGGISYAVVGLAIPLLHAAEAARSNSLPYVEALRATVAVPVALATTSAGVVIAAVAIYPSYVAPYFG
jgi:cellulose synthase (UDP-forming)